MRQNRGGQPEARAQVETPQVKFICIKGLKIVKNAMQMIVPLRAKWWPTGERKFCPKKS
jgi:hypothetical protein